MQSFHNNRLLHACLLHARLLHGCDVTHISSIGRFATSISLRQHANERYAECLGMNWCSKHLIIINNPTQNDLFTEIDNFIEVYNNSVIELVQCFGTSFFGRIDHLASSVIKFRPKNSVPKHCIRSITYNYYFCSIIMEITSWYITWYNFLTNPYYRLIVRNTFPCIITVKLEKDNILFH